MGIVGQKVCLLHKWSRVWIQSNEGNQREKICCELESCFVCDVIMYVLLEMGPRSLGGGYFGSTSCLFYSSKKGFNHVWVMLQHMKV